MKLLDLLVRLYPEEFRARFGADMRVFHAERLREERRSWLRIVFDHIRSAVAEQARALRPDVRHAVRMMARRPGFSAVVVLTVALGVGVNGAIFSAVNGVLLRPLPYAEPDRLVAVAHEPPQWLVSEPQFAFYRQTLRSFESLAAFYTGWGNLVATGEPERVRNASVTRNFFATLGVQPMIGRTFVAGEDRLRPAAVVILSHAAWQRLFHADPNVVGRTLRMNGVPRTVVGVMPEGFAYPSSETQLWLPICSQRTCVPVGESSDSLDGWANHYLSVVARLRARATVQRARTEAQLAARRIMRDHPHYFDPRLPLVPKVASLRDDLVGGARTYLLALLGAVGLVLLIVCVNVANLLLARGESRRREMAVRTALGASRRRMMTQVLTEAGTLALTGGAVGIALAWAGSSVLVALAPASLPRVEQIGLDWLVIAYCFAVALAAGLLFGLIPALRAAREAPADAMRSTGKGSGGGGVSRGARRALVIAEVALAMVILTGAGMLVRSLVHLHGADIGFDARSVLTAEVSLNASAYDDARTIQFYDQLVERVRAIRGVRHAAAARWLPAVDEGGTWDIAVEGRGFPPGQAPLAVPQEVTPGYFAAMGMAILRGRDFTPQDRAGASLVGIVSHSLARAIWPDQDPIGRRFRLGGRDTSWIVVVGVANDIRSRGFTDSPQPTMYVPHAQTQSWYFVPRSMALVVRTSGEPLRFVTPVRAAVRAMDGTVPVSNVRTLEAVVGSSTANRRFSTFLIAGFAVLALVLAGIGIYGVISYAVSERTFEFGVRMALGADRSRIFALVVSDGTRMTVLGILMGIAGSVVLAWAIRSMLFGVSMFDAVTLSVGGAVLGSVALAASALAARRATRVQPTQALRAGS